MRCGIKAPNRWEDRRANRNSFLVRLLPSRGNPLVFELRLRFRIVKRLVPSTGVRFPVLIAAKEIIACVLASTNCQAGYGRQHRTIKAMDTVTGWRNAFVDN